MARKLLGPRGGPVDVVVLNSHVVKLTSKYLYLHS